MKEVFKKITASILALLVLCSTVSFTVEKHYCGRFLVDVAVFSKAKDCGMDGMSYRKDSNQDLCDKSGITKKSCCKNEKIVFEGQDELKLSFDQLELPQQLFLTSLVHSYHIIFSDFNEKEIYFKEYDPPNLVYDYQVVYETFLI